MKSARRSTLTSGELGKAAGVSPDTIRHYERLGLTAKPMRSDGGYRLYPAGTLERVQTIRSALAAGFTLAELAGIFKERAAGGVPCQRVTDLAAGKVDALDRKIRELTELRDWLSATVSDWQQRLEEIPRGTRAGLLERLPAPHDLTALISKGNHNEDDASKLRTVRFGSSAQSAKRS